MVVGHTTVKTASYFAKKAAPGLQKIWKDYEPARGIITETLSPYQQRVMQPLFQDIPHKIVHKLTENWYVPVAIIALIGIEQGLDHFYEESHRAHWP